MTHFATADELDDDGFFDGQLERVRELGARRQGRAARAARARRQQRRDAARAGARTSTWCAAASPIYGMDPFGEDPAARALEPALELSSYVAEVKPCARARAPATGGASSPSATPTSACCRSATATAGGAALSNNADVLIGGRRHPLVGTVSMDNVTVDLGRDRAASGCAASAAILIGIQGSERITAEEVARRLGTINYEITCALTPRVPRALPPRRRAASSRASDADARRLAPARMSARSRPPARARRARRRGWSAAPCATGCWDAQTRDLDLVVDGDPGRGRARDRARGAARAACFALSEEFGAWRVVARDARLAGRRRAAARRHARGGPRAARLHRQRDRRAARRRGADRPARRARRPARRGGCGWPAPSAFADDPLRVLRLVRVAVELGLEPEPRDDPRRRARTRGGAARRLAPSACSSSCAGSSPRQRARCAGSS